MTTPGIPLILAIEPDRKQASKIAALAKGPLHAEVLIADSAERALALVGARVPDLVLTSMLLSPKDESALDARLRELDAAGHHVQTLVIPVLGTARRTRGKTGDGGLLTRLRGKGSDKSISDGCDPAVFATQITEYLERAAADRRAAEADLEDALLDMARSAPPPAPVEAVVEQTPQADFIRELTSFDEPAASVPHVEPVVEATETPVAIAQPEPVAHAEPVVYPESLVPEPVSGPEPVIVPDPIVVPEPVVVPQPILVSDPIAVPDPVVVPEAVALPVPVVAPEPVARPEPVVRAEPVVRSEPVVRPEPVTPRPVAKAKPVVKPRPEPAVKIKAAAKTRAPRVGAILFTEPIEISEPESDSDAGDDAPAATVTSVPPERPLDLHADSAAVEPVGSGAVAEIAATDHADQASEPPMAERAARVVASAPLSPIPLWPRLGGASDLLPPKEPSDPEIAEFTAALDALNLSLALSSMELVEPPAMLHRGLDEDEPALETLEADSDLWMALPAGIIQGWPRMEAPARDALDAGMDAAPAAEPDHAGVEGVPEDAPAEPPRRREPLPSPVAQAAALAALKAQPAAPAAPRSQPAIPRSALAGLARPAAPAKPATPKAEKKPAKVIALPPLSRSVAGLRKMAAQNGPANPAKPQGDTPPLGKLLSSIKRDIEQLRSEQLPPSVLKPKVALTKKVKPAPPAAPEPIAPVTAPVPPVAAPEPPHPAPPEVLETRKTAPPTPAEKEPAAPPAPIQDEWGFFDPNQCGFAALLTKLDEITEEKEKKTKRRR